MSARLSPRATAIVIFAFLIICSSAFAATCSNATLHGNYGFVVTGSSAGNPIAAGGEIQFDGNGSVTGFETTSNNGTIGDELDFTGTYSLAASCSGSLAISPKSGSPSNFKLLSIAGGKVQMTETDAGVVASGFAQSQGMFRCTLPNMQGKYGMTQTGAIVGIGSVALGGPITLHDNGTLSGSLSGSLNGTIVSGQAVRGVYKANRSFCNGGAEITINDGQNLFYLFNVVNNGHEILFIQGDNGTVITGTMER